MHTVDLANRLSTLESKLADIEEGQEALLEEAREKYESYAETPPNYEQKYEQLESNRVEVEGNAEALREVVEEHEDTIFEVKKLTGGEFAELQDEVAKESFDFDPQRQEADGVPKTGYAEVEFVRKAVVKAPDWVEDTKKGTRVIYENDPANLDQPIFKVLSDAANSYNTTGDTDMGNSSFREAMKSNG